MPNAPTHGRKGELPAGESDADHLFDPLSQQSGGSDDAAMRTVVEERMKESWEKKRKEKEAKFLKFVEKELSRCIRSSADEIESIMRNMDETFSNFLLEYAASEDAIRKIWVRIQQEQQTLQSLVGKHLKANTQSVKETEASQIEGMARAKASCEDAKALMSSIANSKR